MCIQDETLILIAAGLGHQRIVKMLLKATTGISEADAKVFHIASIAIVSSCFAWLVTYVMLVRPLTCAALVAVGSVSRECK